jgi:hypothetical protein
MVIDMDDDLVERFKQMDQYEREAFIAEQRERAAEGLDELKTDLARRQEALRAAPLHYSQRAEPEANSSRVVNEAEHERTANDVRGWVSFIDTRIADAIERQHSFMVEVLGEMLNHITEEREQVERDFRVKLLELRSDLTERMCATLEALRKVAGDRDVIDLPKWPSKRGPTPLN